jgi:eukaryotic-like serine/threonine-protein kinase
MAGPHDHILQAYTNVSLLKEGGQKAAYLVTDPTHGRMVVKIGHYPSPTSLERIRREVELLREVDSPYYPKNIDFRIVPPDQFIIFEEYIESRPLSTCLGEFGNPKSALLFLRQLVQGLTVIWNKRVVHRDLKPDNILVLPDYSPKIIDLGIARLLDEDSLTKTVNARGPCTPNYGAPEQLKNRKAHIDQRTDQFALGILFVQLLLRGAHPFDPARVGSGDSISFNILKGAWTRKTLQASVAASLYEIANRLLGPEPFNRFRDADSLLRAVADAEREVK